MQWFVDIIKESSFFSLSIMLFSELCFVLEFFPQKCLEYPILPKYLPIIGTRRYSGLVLALKVRRTLLETLSHMLILKVISGKKKGQEKKKTPQWVQTNHDSSLRAVEGSVPPLNPKYGNAINVIWRKQKIQLLLFFIFFSLQGKMG